MLSDEEKRLYQEKQANLISALLGLPSRSSALLTVSGAVATLLASAALFGATNWPASAQDDTLLPWLIIIFLLVLILVTIGVWLALGALAPVSFAEFEPDRSFVADALDDLQACFDPSKNIECEVNDYMLDIAALQVAANSKRLEKKHSNVIWAVRLLRGAFVLAIGMFGVSVIIKSGSADSLMQFYNLKNKDFSIIRGVPADSKGSDSSAKSQPIISPRSGRAITSGRIVDATEQGRAPSSGDSRSRPQSSQKDTKPLPDQSRQASPGTSSPR